MIEIIPAIDVIDGKCVRLTKGDYCTAKIYSANPVEIARSFEDAGCRKLHLVDLDGAKSQHIVNYNTLESIALKTGLTIDFGGGVKHEDDVRVAFESGASKVTLGSVAVKEASLALAWLDKYGSDRIIIGADSRDGKISASGWLDDSDDDIMSFLEKYVTAGVTQVISTDINVDGTLSGPATELYSSILERFPSLILIASGGVGSMDDVDRLNDISVPGVIVGKAIYEGRITMKQLENFNTRQ